jgi:hypothetical protein
MFVGAWLSVAAGAVLLNKALRFPLHVELRPSSVTIVFAFRRHTIHYETIHGMRIWKGEVPNRYRICGWVLPYCSMYPWSFWDEELGQVKVFGPAPATTAKVLIVPATGTPVLLILKDPTAFSSALTAKLDELRMKEPENAL